MNIDHPHQNAYRENEIKSRGFKTAGARSESPNILQRNFGETRETSNIGSEVTQLRTEIYVYTPEFGSAGAG